MSNSLYSPLIKGIPIGTVAPTHLLAVGADIGKHSVIGNSGHSDHVSAIDTIGNLVLSSENYYSDTGVLISP